MNVLPRVIPVSKTELGKGRTVAYSKNRLSSISLLKAQAHAQKEERRRYKIHWTWERDVCYVKISNGPQSESGR